MPLTRQQKKTLGIHNLDARIMTNIDQKLVQLQLSLQDSISRAVERSRHEASFESLGNRRQQIGQRGQTQFDQQHHGEGSPRMKVEFPQWEGGYPAGWVSRAKKYFRFH
ncbi:hypothetical protein GBA52_003674 [Prunus armeniaca]|nr:hypothetical protein GBA52_003674 [Prunus armeniaca]